MQITKELFGKGIISNPKMVTQSQFSQIQFQAVVENVSMFYKVLKGINFVDSAMVQLSKEGIKLTLEDAKCVQVVALVKSACFSEYNLSAYPSVAAGDDGAESEPFASFGLNLKVFTDCLSMFASSDFDPSLKIMRKGPGTPLVAILEGHREDNLITECAVRTMEPFDCMDLDFDDDHPIVSKIAAKASELFLLFSELDDEDVIEVIISPTAPHFKLKALGDPEMETEIEIKKTSDIFISFSCSEASSNRYKLNHFKHVMRTLSLATKVVLSTNTEGLLSFQVIIETLEDSLYYVQYFILPLVLDSD
ncbi:cell cycle checkpoint protein RAD1 [Anopheles bellator]|uniref:cell cycle checkpoint protein RAD1 n=1 Tax=Anopheles bellator TaxID=139047 RepID=UPI0026473C07|nr:cell cycle checkpoint protein RAD1 [Anopheles bellator]